MSNHFVRLSEAFQENWPGLVVSAVVGMAALFLSDHYGAPAMLFALLLGIAVSFLHQEETSCKPGIEFSARQVLRAGVALLGLRIAFSDLALLGWATGITLLVAITSTILFGIGFARILGLSQRFGALTGGAVGICGASAALAISAILPDEANKERDTLVTVIGVTALSTLAMIIYPILVSYLGLSETQASIFLGGTIHDVAQVVGAGYSVSELTGDRATLTKLVRVAMLMPAVLIMMLAFHRHTPVGTKVPPLPSFLVGFVVLMTANSLFELPQTVLDTAKSLSRFFLIAAISAIGMKSNLSQLVKVGFKPILLMLVETIWIAVLIMSSILLS